MKSSLNFVLSIALIGGTAGVVAQQTVMPQSLPERIDEEAYLMTAPSQLPLTVADTLMFTQLELAGPDEVVLGKPYSADLTVVTHQPLVDGNSITVEHHARVYRDGDGRTRREDDVGASSAPAQRVFIADPVAGTSYLLDPDRRYAQRLTATPPPGVPDPQSVTVVAGIDAGVALDVAPAPRPAGDARFELSLPPADDQVSPGRTITLPFAGEPQTVSLGERVIEGVNVVGTRSVVVIPAATVGNRAPIEIVTEQWYSPELRLIVLSEHHDPRVGETRYRLHGIRRESPGAALFSVPLDYTVTESSP